MATDPFAALNKACVKSFGSTVSYRQGTADPFSVQGVLVKDSDEEQHREGLYARLFVNLADFASPPDHGDEATIGGVAYTVFNVLADAMGGAHLSLRAVA
jgi:hypothetical protein